MDISKLKKNLKLYLVFTIIFYLLIIAICALFIILFNFFVVKHSQIQPTKIISVNLGLIFAIIYLFFSCFLHVIGRFMVDNRTKNTYTYEIIILCLGLLSLITIIPSILILLEWSKPEVKKYYNND